MNIVDESAAFIAVFEGCCKLRKDGLIHVYICPAGYATQGYGIRVLQSAPPITKEEAMRRFKKALPKYINEALRLSPNLTGTQLVAITSFIYNLGPTAYAGSTLRKRVNSNDWQGASRELQKWVFGGGRKLPGLVKRRKAEAQLLLS